MTDYYIALGINYLGRPALEFNDSKRFFWCTSENLKFSELPAPLTDKCRPLFDQIQAVFTGEFEKVIVEPTGISQYLQPDQDLLRKVTIPHRGLTELDRLSYVVHQMDNDCHLVPKGSVKKIPLNEIRRNEAFRGLRADQSVDISNYSHFRLPISKEKVELNARNEGIYNNDFLDSATDDIPKGCWSILRDTTGTVAVLRNKMWPGFTVYHRANTNVYGCFYIGNGCKALDMPFMF